MENFTSFKNLPLCTSAEWEYAARAGTTTPWSFPEDPNPQDYAWYDSNNKDPYGTGPKQIKTKLPNAFGLYDDDFLIGICTFGSPPSPSLCVGVCGEKHKDKVLRMSCDNKNKLNVGVVAT